MKKPILKVNGLTYNMGFLTKEYDDGQSYGISDPLKQVIQFKRGLTEEKAMEVLIHEVVHLVLQNGCYFNESKNEKLVQCLASGIYQMLKENKLLK